LLWPGIKKLGKELNFKRTDSEVTGMLKNCFVRMYDGNQIKVLELFVPQMDSDDKNDIIKKLESGKIKKYEWLSGGVKIIFQEYLLPYSTKKIRGILDELVKYFSSKYPGQKPACQHCGVNNETEIYSVNNAAFLICDNCYRQYERNISNDNNDYLNAPNNYLQGFLGALLFAIPGIIVTVIFFVFLNRLAAVSAVVYILLGIFGYKKFNGKITPVGAVLIIVAGLIMVGIGVFAAYSILIFRELKTVDFDLLLIILKMPEVQRELIINIILSYIVSMFYFAFQLFQMMKEWKNIKSIQKPKEIKRRVLWHGQNLIP